MLALRPSSLTLALVASLPLALACSTDPEPTDTQADTGTDEVESSTDTATTTDDEASSSESASDTSESTSETTTDDTTSETTTDDTTTETTGSSDCAGECGTPNCGVCPESPVVEVPGGFTIGATEVRNGDYALFLDVVFEADYLDGWLPSECGWKNNFTPTDWSDNLPEDLPVIQVDWCDAWAYCEWSGQELCGAIGGGPIDGEDINDPALAQWHKACTGGGVAVYPYGVSYDPLACNGLDAGFEQLIQVGSLADCEGGYPGIFDMAGNVWEWENSCIPNPMVMPQSELCQQRGGSYFSDSLSMLCSADTPRARNFRNHNVGFRCCDTP
ncbi:formylglycine-generating enzyme family protein [Nannocystaceae bacterium ST9]